MPHLNGTHVLVTVFLLLIGIIVVTKKSTATSHYEVEIVGTGKTFVTSTMPGSADGAYQFIDSASGRHLKIPIDKAVIRW